VPLDRPDIMRIMKTTPNPQNQPDLVSEWVARTALERGISPSEARRLLVEQIDHARREKIGRNSSAPVRRKLSANPQRRIFRTEPEPIDEKTPVSQEPVKSALPEPAPEPAPEPVNPHSANKNRVLHQKDPHPGTQTAIVVAVIREEISFADAETKLWAMPQFRRLRFRSELRTVMFRACRNYNLEIK
jgi:hypothetical protein